MKLIVVFVYLSFQITMSDNLSPVDNFKFVQSIRLTENSPKFVNKSTVNESQVALTLSITNNFVRQLGEISAKYSLSHVCILNSQIDFFNLGNSTRLEQRLRALVYEVFSKLKTVKGNQRKVYMSRAHSIAIFKSELDNVKKQSFALHTLNIQNVEYEKRCRELYKKLQDDEEMQMIISEQNLEIFTLEHKTARLKEEISELKEKLPSITNEHQDLDQLLKRTHDRRLKTLKRESEKALWFLETFGLTLKSLVLKDAKSKSISFDFDKNVNYDSLPEDKKGNIKDLVFLMDKFCISDAAYHELSMISHDLPRSYMVIECRSDINKTIEIERLPGNVPGAMVNIATEVNKLVENHLKRQPDSKKVKVKLSGDGARVSRISNFVIFSLSDASNNTKLSYQEQKTVGIVECGENYDNMKKHCKPIFDEINSLLSKKVWTVNGKQVEVDFFISADMKFLQLVLGLNGATSEFACPWCKVSKEGRSDTSKPWDYYHSNCNARTIAEMTVNAKSGKVVYGSKFSPLLQIPIDHIIVDELHLMLRITDVLLRNLIDDAKGLDDDSKIVGCSKGEKLDKLVKLIQNCGVSFAIWKNKSGDIEWTSLSGSDKSKLLNHLPDLLIDSDVIHEDTKHEVVTLWRDFLSLYRCLMVESEENGEALFERGRKWLQCFLSIGETRIGYAHNNVTPYMHCLVYHVPFFIAMYGPLKQFSGQGVEKNNDVVKQLHQKKSNKWDSTVSCLVARKRLEYGYDEDRDRCKRTYEKKSGWWQEPLRNARSSKRKLIKEAIEAADTSKRDERVCFDSMSEHELRLYLKDNGKPTKIRNREKLLKLISSL